MYDYTYFHKLKMNLFTVQRVLFGIKMNTLDLLVKVSEVIVSSIFEIHNKLCNVFLDYQGKFM